jgi:hypothetical protein
MVGEASISLATACYGKTINGNSGYDGNDVLYLAFTGSDAVPGASGANWSANSFDAFESSIQSLGDSLVARIGGVGFNGSGSGGNSSNGVTRSEVDPAAVLGSLVALVSEVHILVYS